MPAARPDSDDVGYAVGEGGLLGNLSLLDNAALPDVYHFRRSLAQAKERAEKLLAELGLSAGNVRVIRHRGLERLRGCMNATSGEAS